MKKILGIIGLIALFIVGIYCFFNDYNHNNDLIYYGGTIISMRDSTDKIEAIYVKNGKIVEIGTKEALLKLKTANTQLVDLQGKTLMPL